MLELDPLLLEGDLLKTLHPALKKIDIPIEPFTINSPPGPEGITQPQDIIWEGQRAFEDYPIR
jgi:hypothetical protein